MTFKHPLARDAKVWSTAGLKGEPQQVLVIVTTLELDPEHKKFKTDKVQALKDAAQDWIGNSAGAASDFMLVNRAKEWAGAGH